MAESINITELPLDILVLVFPYLDAKSFLAFCSTCKAFQQPSIRLDPAYWSFQSRSTFRIPNQPVVQHDGVRWQKMYKRLFTQTRVYTWGSEGNNRLGHQTNARSCPSPQEMHGAREMGVIADLQNGGWSTTILNSKGTLYSVGLLDGERSWGGNADPKALTFPPGYPQSPAAAAYNEPTIAIRQFSSGRSHILGLSDSGRIWSWHSFDHPAVQIKFVNIDLKEDSSGGSKLANSSLFGTVKQVVAGWSYSSAYIHGVGVVAWEPLRPRAAQHGPRRARSVPRRLLQRDPEPDEPDTMLLLENFELPKTGYQRPKGAVRESDQDRALGEEVGQVKNHIVLEHFVVFVTDIGKVFCSRLDEKGRADNILELCAFGGEIGKPLDVQGSFRTFAVFSNGRVVIAEQDYLERSWNARTTNPNQTEIAGLKYIPALQHNNVVSIAFGDWHFLALHSTGKITAYGKGVGFQESLGLGALQAVRLRGLDSPSFARDGYTRGKEVWFRKEQQEWLELLHSGGKDVQEAAGRYGLYSGGNLNILGELGEWIEQEAKVWDEDKGEDGLGAYFALRVSAAGHHSGAVLLVNEELAKKEINYDWRNKSFPRLVHDGEEMPGSVPIDEWREGRPEL
ncbi:RCC1/BLIP-II protein [Paraphaeosphaeria sporulosa]|uniref:RCC1/BLIP-II protein n=1 Tax=Paraphaeosphaeria sporulosa TaxID=1460663 RepID=A0A177C5D4_9PLEO|nr:RCC1/BLIP-II protein [Paraphaeosphaeria sporulosa]OAG02964.1 RCC1/BLIP-II protein [Paraphaeosphaeria sporulosa]